MACLAGLIGDSSVRECLFAVANTGPAAAAEATLALVVRGLTGPNRAHAAVLLAYSAAVRGNTVLASTAPSTSPSRPTLTTRSRPSWMQRSRSRSHRRSCCGWPHTSA
ncbi:DUF4192 family protein [Nocardia cyriacigeorgica]|nr:DUF4192 family protein [Nocardia cyriacigeorgica]